jgi:hypothetical protein
MKRNRKIIVYIAILLLANLVVASDRKPWRNSLVGTWKLNLAKSAWDKIPAPKEDTLVVIQDDVTGLKWTASGVSADGDSFSFEGAADGKDYPMKSPNNEAVIGFTRAYRESVQYSKQSIRRTARLSRPAQPQFQMTARQ